MNVSFCQIYLIPNVSFPFTYLCQGYLATIISRVLKPTNLFLDKYGPNYDLMFYISAKLRIKNNKIVGPSLNKKNLCVEFTIFLPFSVIQRDDNPNAQALRYLLNGVCTVLESFAIDCSEIRRQQETYIREIINSPEMIETEGDDIQIF